jgi:plasmid replication initiation protein
MARLKDKHPNRDFFIMEISDVVPKDDAASMEHPIFSLATKPDLRRLKYENNGNTLKVIPSTHGLATIHDKDILIWAISKIMDAKNKGEPYSRTINGSGYELLSATNRGISKRDYDRLEKAFIRLRGTTFVSDIRTGGKAEKNIFGMVDQASFNYDFGRDMRRDKVTVTLSEWMFRVIESNEVLTISSDYFYLRKPMERRLYEIARKHCGYKQRFEVGLKKLQTKTGSNAPLKLFRQKIKVIIADDDLPFYKLELTEKDMVIIRPRTTKKAIGKNIIIPSWAEEKAREIAVKKGRDYYALEQEWLAFADNPENAGAAFIGFCKQKKSLR